ncbi:radiation-inducible immediate-early gene IEX-1 isoform X4 [Onychostruthus taczanowskii]|uniref:radiation-inducible immediate-early gene IEX-1 isoform X4 n=1 Tax=Onychostruthus taczanowskii TaxID=356909 RepID=UPI001B800658|nr:radiation-inducible immediate-early gene IEX-1 isoform X4 [Onychostruthus taczanowskii]
MRSGGEELKRAGAWTEPREMRGAIGQNHAIPGVGGAWQRHKRGGGRRSRPFLGLERVPVTGGTALRPPPRRNRRRRELRRTVEATEGQNLE